MKEEQKQQELSPNFCLHRNLSALSVRSIRHVLCPPPTSSSITSPSLSSFFLILSYTFIALFAIPFHSFFGGHACTHIPVISVPSIFLLLPHLNIFCTFCTFSPFPGKSSTKKTRKKALIRIETPEICIKQLKSATSPKNY